jgi:hypothetical protein
LGATSLDNLISLLLNRSIAIELNQDDINFIRETFRKIDHFGKVEFTIVNEAITKGEPKLVMIPKGINKN